MKCSIHTQAIIFLGLVVCFAQTTVAQDRKTFDEGFDAKFSVLFEAPEPGALTAIVSPDGRYRAKSEHGTLRVWSVKNDQPLREFRTSGLAYAPTFTSDGEKLFAATCRGNLGCLATVHSFDLGTGNVTRIGECSGLVRDISFDGEARVVAVATWYSSIVSMVSKKHDKWFGGEIVVFDTARPNTSLRIFCELSGITASQSMKNSPNEKREKFAAEWLKQFEEAQQRCAPVRVGLTPDGAKVIGITSTGVARVFDAQTGKAEVLLSSHGRGTVKDELSENAKP